MSEKKIKKLPVVRKNKLVGILTTSDICRSQQLVIEDLERKMTGRIL